MRVTPERTSATLPLKVLAIIVVYRLSPAESSSLATLLTAAKVAPGVSLKIIVADNTPGGQSNPGVPGDVEYKSYPENPGLAQPYNDALAVAAAEGVEWLLTLDQDTELPSNFLAAMAQTAALHASDPNVAAVVPRIQDAGRPISPFVFVRGFWPVVLSGSARGVAPRHASAINSGALLRVPSLLQLGGYDPNFPLHNSDTRVFHGLDKAGKRLAIADITVQHEFSILRREERMSPERYRLMLEDECRFWDLHMTPYGRAERMLRLIGRYAKSVLQGEHPAFRKITAAEIRRRALGSRGKRLHTSSLMHM